MAKVVAKVRGYFGGEIREPGSIFDVPDDLKNPPKWTRPYSFGGKGDHDGDGKTGGSKPAEVTADQSKPAGPVVVPADWRDGKAADRKALAKAITGENVANATEADRIIAAYVEASESERGPFADAPAPVTVTGNGVAEAIGGVQPDWIAPGSTGETGDDI
ncbi:hypothetical protein [Hyphomicrobium sp. 99]|uniref:hypothetical protein n=1 Tax=Hyphomicrobium sp. 99 TaxID=1163419 RepID=UPI0005F84BCB|nr:hypothetical protein [Hyphomicrobium sp. 99]